MRFTIAATLALGVCAGTACAQPGGVTLPEERTSYLLSGNDSERGGFTSNVTIDPEPGIDFVEVIRHVWYDSHPGKAEMQRGYGAVEDGTLKVRLLDRAGAIGGLEEREARATDFFVNIQPNGQMDTIGRSVNGHSSATGFPRDRRPDETPAGSLAGRIMQRGKHLVALAESSLRKHLRQKGEDLFYDEHDIEDEFKISRYLHVGIGGSIHALEPGELNAEQQFTSRRRPHHVWIKSEVHGGVRVPLSTTIPVAEGVSVSVGLHPGARVGYAVTDLYPVPRGLSKDELRQAVAALKHISQRSFDLPINAAEAEAMTVGASRVFDGEARVGIRGSIGFGYEIANIEDVLKIGASARLGGFYRVSGDMRITVERLIGSRVRIRVRRGDTEARGLHADLLVGATLDEDWVRDKISPGIEYLDEALIKTENLPESVREKILEEVEDEVVDEVTGVVRKVIRLRLRGNSSRSDRNEVDVAWICNLNSPQARAGYDRAIRGDFTHLGELSLEPDSGVSQEHRVVEAEEHTHFSIGLQLSILLDARYSRDIRLSDLVVEDAKGTTAYEIFRYDRSQRFNLFGDDSYKTMSAEVIRREREGGVVRSLRMTLDIFTEHTWESEGDRIQRMLSSWGLDGTSALPKPEFELFRSRYRETRLRVRVVVNEAGVEALLRASRRQVRDAYIEGYIAIEASVPRWASRDGRQTLWNNRHNDNSTGDKTPLDELKAMNAFLDSTDAMRTATTKETRASALKALTAAAEFDHFVLTAILNVVPRESIGIDASFLGERIRVVDSHGGGLAPVPVERP